MRSTTIVHENASAVFPSAEAPEGFQYLPESRLAQELTKPFLRFFYEGVPLAYALLVSIEQLILEGQLVQPDLNSLAVRLKQGLKAAAFPAVWFRRSVAVSNLDHIPKGGLMVRIEVADMLKEWDLISGALPRLNGIPVWLLCGETEVPAHCKATGLPALPNDIRIKGTMLRFIREYYASIPRWSREIRASLAGRRFPAGAFQRVLGCMAMTLMNAVQARELLMRTQPRMVVVDCDHSPMSAWLIFFARQMGIASATLQHGSIPDTPLWADHALLWGEQSARTFSAHGARSDQLHLVGYPRLDTKLRAVDEVAAFKRSRGIPADSKIVVLATEKDAPEVRLRLASAAWEGVRRAPGHTLLIKCHPAELDKEVYSPVFEGDPRGRVFAHSELALDLALSMADVVLAEWSSVATDALIKGRPVILMDLKGNLLANQKMRDFGACLSAKDGDELLRLLESGEYDHARHPETAIKAREFLKDTCVAFGDDAAERVAATLRSIWTAA